LLDNVPGIEHMAVPADVEWNGAYCPIFVNAHFPISRDALYARLKEHGINGRRYFFPLISSMPMYRGLPSANPKRLPNAHAAADKVLCLPIYPDLPLEDVARICVIIDEAARG